MNQCNKEMCCCNCINQLIVYKHPANNSVFSKGSISEYFGYACKANISELINNNEIIFFDEKHGMCEHFELK